MHGPKFVTYARTYTLITHLHPRIGALRSVARPPASHMCVQGSSRDQGAMREFDHPVRAMLGVRGRGRSAGASLAAGLTGDDRDRAQARQCCAVCVACGLGRREATSAAQAWLQLKARSTGAAPSPTTVCPRPESVTALSIGVASGTKKRPAVEQTFFAGSFQFGTKLPVGTGVRPAQGAGLWHAATALHGGRRYAGAAASAAARAC